MNRPPIRGAGYMVKGGAGPTRAENARRAAAASASASPSPATASDVAGVQTRASAAVRWPLVAWAALAGTAWGAAAEALLWAVYR